MFPTLKKTKTSAKILPFSLIRLIEKRVFIQREIEPVSSLCLCVPLVNLQVLVQCQITFCLFNGTRQEQHTFKRYNL